MTVDEIKITPIKISLIEGKHTKNALLPSKGDIKDGLLKLILYSNLSEVAVNGNKVKSEAILNLTSSKLNGAINSSGTKKEITNFYTQNNFSTQQVKLTETIFAEAKQNNFIIQIQYSE
ncbi:MAG: hypothetical protein LRY27_01750 [Chitinophagales bacterium]|nr:hypothetical protein [Chitinophagales bacterium]